MKKKVHKTLQMQAGSDEDDFDGKKKFKEDQTRTKLSKKRFLQYLRKSLGVVTPACDKTGVSRRCYYDWLRDDPDFAKSVKDIEEILKDFAETALFKAAKMGNSECIKFLCKAKVRDRGYSDNAEDGAKVPLRLEIEMVSARNSQPQENTFELPPNDETS